MCHKYFGYHVAACSGIACESVKKGEECCAEFGNMEQNNKIACMVMKGVWAKEVGARIACGGVRS